MKRVCKIKDCLQLEYITIDGVKTGYCIKHQRYYEEALEKRRQYFRGSKFQERRKELRPYIRLYDSSRWKRLRDRKLLDNPICEICYKALSEEVDHIKPHRGNLNLFYNYENLQSLCKSCHSKKTAEEQIIKKKEEKH